MAHSNIFRLAATLAFAVSPLLLTACDETKSAPVAEVRPVKAEPAHFKPGNDLMAFAGIVAPRYETALGFRIAGKVTSREVDVGQQVKAGAVLARIDTADYELQRRNALAQVAAAEADVVKAKADLTRYEQLRSSPAFTPAVYDQRKQVTDAAEARLNQARANLRIYDNQMGYTVLKADADGIVTAVAADAGQVVAAGQWVVKIARDGEREIVANVPEQRLDELRQAQIIKVQLWSNPGKLYDARVREISPMADNLTRTYATRFSLLDADAGVALGMTATVGVPTGDFTQVASFPLTALFQQGKEPALWVVDPKTGSLTLKPVKVASYREDAVLVASGVNEGDMVVTAGVHKLDAAQRVRLFGAAR